MTLEVVREAVDLAVRGLVSLLKDWDPSPGMENPPPGQFSRFAVYLQAYEDEGAWKYDQASHRSKDVNGYPDPLDLYEKFADAYLKGTEGSDG